MNTLAEVSCRITQIGYRKTGLLRRKWLFPGMAALSAIWLANAAADGLAEDRSRFVEAWQAAARGDRATLERLEPQLRDYVLHPYLRYDDLLQRRARVDGAEMSAFLAGHADWAFAAGLRGAWLKALAEHGRWSELLQWAGDETGTELQCHVANARVRSGRVEGQQAVAQELWAAGKSQPHACDPLFDWLRESSGITPELAWKRIGLAMAERNPRLTLYLARFVPAHDRIWVERWQQHDAERYSRLEKARAWPDNGFARDITAFGLTRLAQQDADRAGRAFAVLDGHFDWGKERRGEILHDIALWSAVALSEATPQRMRAVPEASRSDRLLEWWARHGLAAGDWAEVILSVAAMSEATRGSERWQYWDARARLQMGDPEYAQGLLEHLAGQATYHGFLAADLLGRPYAICPAEPQVDEHALDDFRRSPRVQRVIELQKSGLRSWSRQEWKGLTEDLDPARLRLAAAVASAEDWPDFAITALAASGDRDWYAWRFPLTYSALVSTQAERRQLDLAWVLGLMRSESAMAADAISTANARGLMQVTPGTAQEVARRHALNYRGAAQLLHPEDNIRFGTAFLSDLMNRFDGNPVLVSGAYNAGPGAVSRWLDTQPVHETAIWIETLPYHETREYIPRVLAFSTIYDWRLDRPVRRLSSRMPALAAEAPRTQRESVATVACPVEMPPVVMTQAHGS